MPIKRRTSCRIPPEPKTDQLKVSVVRDNDVQLNKRFLSSKMEIECYNFTGRTIKTYDHTGVCCIHKPITTTADNPEFIGCFVMKKRYEINEQTQVTYSEGEQTLSLSQEAEKYAEEVIREINRSRGLTRRSAAHYFTIKITDLNLNEGVIYVKSTDLVVVDESKHRGTIVHPNSKAYMDMRIDQLYDSAHTYSIEINDPRGPGAPFFVSLNDKVFEVVPTRDTNVGDGAKIVYKQPHQPAVTVAYSSLEPDELAKIGIFKDYSDADKYGKRFEIKLAELEQQTQLAKHEGALQIAENKQSIDDQATSNKLTTLLTEMIGLQQQSLLDRDKREGEWDKLERERNKAIQDAELLKEKHRRELEDMRMKDYYENRSYSRKDSSEGLKFLPILVGGIVAAVALINRG